MPLDWAPSTLAAQFTRKELYLAILGGDLGQSADGVTIFVPGRVLFSMSLS
jgi:hypothetical protein